MEIQSLGRIKKGNVNKREKKREIRERKAEEKQDSKTSNKRGQNQISKKIREEKGKKNLWVRTKL